jgi:acyl-CoA thioesterase
MAAFSLAGRSPARPRAIGSRTVADFLDDTRVEAIPGAPGSYRSALSPDWAVWGPNGGYVAAIALRAAMAASRLPRPASFQCHFLAVGEFAPVELRVRSLGGGKRAESLRVEVVQGERTLLVATAWMVEDGLRGFEHDVGIPPGVPAPAALRGYQELAGEEYAEWYPIWRSIEGRPVRWREPPGAPQWHTWLRFTATAIPDRAADALRQLFWLDFPGWNATTSAHPWPFRFLAPNLDLSVQFLRFAPEESWILAEGHVPLAVDGMVGCDSRLWTEDGRLLAIGTSMHLCRPNPGYEEELARARSQGLLPPDSR